VVDKLHDATEKALQDPALQQRLANLGVEPEQMSVEAFAKVVKDDIAATVQLAKAAHIEAVD
jgi:tripartite-type tricarboxylate transporter receptor subunit TctC